MDGFYITFLRILRLHCKMRLQILTMTKCCSPKWHLIKLISYIQTKQRGPVSKLDMDVAQDTSMLTTYCHIKFILHDYDLTWRMVVELRGRRLPSRWSQFKTAFPHFSLKISLPHCKYINDAEPKTHKTHKANATTKCCQYRKATKPEWHIFSVLAVFCHCMCFVWFCIVYVFAAFGRCCAFALVGYCTLHFRMFGQVSAANVNLFPFMQEEAIKSECTWYVTPWCSCEGDSTL